MDDHSEAGHATRRMAGILASVRVARWVGSRGMDEVLAGELKGMGEQQVLAVGAFFGAVSGDPALVAACRGRLGWDPTQDPVEMWRDGPPRLLTGVEWPDAPPAAARVIELAADHLARLRAIVEEHGWPGRSLVGEDGADAAWFLAMHSDRDPSFQRRCIALLERAVEAGEADPRHLAGLVDRVESAASGTQQFGTVAMMHEGRALFLVPVSVPDGLDVRRRAIGLPPVQDDLALEAGQLPYRHLRKSPSYAWPARG
ncbi:MAG TPA: DUF6624 domain-containing protein [Acidimicrobiales bacterium]|nr:DUF6624 domain-containing protein [Acidimicrobiales bacterium]